MKGYESYLQEAEERLSLWRSEIEGLFSRGRLGDPNAQEHGHRLRALHQQAEQRLAQLRTATGDSWHAVRDGFVETLDELQATFANAIVETTSGPAPQIPNLDWDEPYEELSHASNREA